MPTNSNLGDVLDLPLTLDHTKGNRSRQVHAALREAILSGRVAAGSRLPPTRMLADQIDVPRNAVVVAYEHLQVDGLVEAKTGAGTYVADYLPTPQRPASDKPTLPIGTSKQGPLALGKTDCDIAIMRRFAAALRHRALTSSSGDLGYGDPRGSLVLRQALSVHLATSRGIHCDPGCIIVTAGIQQGLRLIAAALFEPGDAIWFEDPGYVLSRMTLADSGLQPVAIPVDDEGIDVAMARTMKPDAKGVYVTPSNQFPTGVTMTMPRRITLIDWARETNGWIIEDDYDNEFRYEGPPLLALAGINSDRVLYIGTLSKTLFAGLRLAYMVLPPAVMEKVAALRATHDRFPPTLSELAVADVMRDGSLATHVRRMRTRYRQARDLLAAELKRWAGDRLTLRVPSQGLHVVAYLPDGADTDAAHHIRASAGIDVWLISETRIDTRGPDGFILGFAGHEPAELKRAAETLGNAVNHYFQDR
jgi:GntR family transcriptional regulator/MocR family aminotransferase